MIDQVKFCESHDPKQKEKYQNHENSNHFNIRLNHDYILAHFFDQSSSNVTMTPTWDNSWSVWIDWSIGPRQTGSSERSPADLKLLPHLDSSGLRKCGFLTNRGNKTGPSGRSSPEGHLLDYYLHLTEVNCWVIDADGRLTAGHTGEFIHHNTSCWLCEVSQQQHWQPEIQNLRSRTWDPEPEIQNLSLELMFTSLLDVFLCDCFRKSARLIHVCFKSHVPPAATRNTETQNQFKNQLQQ